MRFFQTLPTDNVFFRVYAKISKGIQFSTIFTQLISGMTEGVILFSLLFTTLSFLLTPEQARFFSFIGAVLGVLVLEIGLRFFLPHSIDAILYKRYEGLYLAMTIFIFAMTIGLLGASGYLSYEGSKDYIKNNAPTLTEKTTTKIDSTYLLSRSTFLENYKMDSTTIAENSKQLIQGIKQAFNSSIDEQKLKLNTLPKSKAESWSSWNGRKNVIKGKIKAIQAERDKEIVILTTDKVNQLKQLKQAKNDKLATIENEYKTATLEIENDNETAQNEIDATAEKQGTGFGWITIIFLIYFVVCTTIDRIHKKGSGIEETPVPTDYYFRPSVISEASSAIKERFNQLARQRIANFQASTAAPPMPSTPHQLLNIVDFQQPQYKLNFNTSTAPTLPTGKTTNENIEDVEILENQITDYIEASVTLESNNLHEQANEMRLKANEVIKAYLQRNGTEPTTNQIQDLESKVFEFVNNVTTVNPFANRTVIKGFQTQNYIENLKEKTQENDHSKNTPYAMRMTQERTQMKQGAKEGKKTQENALKTGNNKIKNCLHCGTVFQYKTTWQKFCKKDCRTAAWELKTGKELMLKKAKK